MKKISYDEAAFIRRYKKKHRFEMYFCNWYIEKKNPNCGYMKLYMKKWVYMLLFIPIHVLTFLYCLWDGGIKEMSFHPRMMTYDNITGLTCDNDETTEFGRFKIIWEGNTDEEDS